MLGMLFGSSDRSPNLVPRMKRLEKKLDLILSHLGIDFVDVGETLSEQTRSLADRGEKIAAIKQYRNETGVGLAEAKQAIEEYLRQS